MRPAPQDRPLRKARPYRLKMQQENGNTRAPTARASAVDEEKKLERGCVSRVIVIAHGRFFSSRRSSPFDVNALTHLAFTSIHERLFDDRLEART